MISAPMFSVIIATYNRAEHLERAVKSLLIQTETDWEGIIVDDGSTDDTHSRILPLIEKNPGIKYFRKQHSGEALTKNYGIKVSKGKFITFLDSDDEYHPDHLTSRKRFLIRNPYVKFLHGGVKIIGNQYVPDKNDPTVKINLNDCAIGGTFFIERETLKALRGFRKILLGPDSELFDRAVKRKITMAEIDMPTYIYHHDNPDSITNILFQNIRET